MLAGQNAFARFAQEEAHFFHPAKQRLHRQDVVELLRQRRSLSALIVVAVESVTCASGRAHRAGSRRGKAANRERFFADRTLQIREDYIIGDDVLRVDGGRGK
jgi:hypothetical protein